MEQQQGDSHGGGNATGQYVVTHSHLVPDETATDSMSCTSSEWYRHPECKLGVSWRTLVNVKNGRVVVRVALRKSRIDPDNGEVLGEDAEAAGARAADFLRHNKGVMAVLKSEPLEDVVHHQANAEDQREQREQCVVVCAIQARVSMAVQSGRIASHVKSCAEVPKVVPGEASPSTTCLLVGTALFSESSGKSSFSGAEIVVTVTIAYLALPDTLAASAGCLTKRQPSVTAVDTMFTTKEYSIVNVVLDSGEQIPVHKAVLAAASPEMRTKFLGSMHDPVPTRLHFGDVSSDVFNEVMSYIYTGRHSSTLAVDAASADHRKLVLGVLSLAVNFGLTGLAASAELLLVNGGVADHEAETLAAALERGAPFLKRVVMVRMALAWPSSDEQRRRRWKEVLRRHRVPLDEFLDYLETAVGAVTANTAYGQK